MTGLGRAGEWARGEGVICELVFIVSSYSVQETRGVSGFCGYGHQMQHKLACERG